MSRPITRWASRGDTISTVRPQQNGDHLHAIVVTPESCAEGNELIASGRWRVSRCGRCDVPIEECTCTHDTGGGSRCTCPTLDGVAVTGSCCPVHGLPASDFGAEIPDHG